MGRFLRRGHAAEIFRAAFYESRNAGFRVSVLDLDQLVSIERERPSVLVKPFELAGLGLGLATRLSPFPTCATQITEAVDDATVNQFNDVSPLTRARSYQLYTSFGCWPFGSAAVLMQALKHNSSAFVTVILSFLIY
jgi:hypothetical protein